MKGRVKITAHCSFLRMLKSFLLFVFLMPGLSAQDSLNLQDVIGLVLENNYGILIAKNEASMAANNNHIGQAGFLPRVSGSVSRSYTVNNTRQELFSGQVREGKDARSDNFSPGIMLNYTLFDGFNMFVQKEKLEELEVLGELQARIQIENRVTQTILLYYRIIQEHRNLEVIREAMQLTRDRILLAEKGMEIGTASRPAYLQARVDLNADSANYLQILSQWQSDLAALNVMMNRTPSQELNLRNEFDLIDSLQFPDLLEKAKTENAALQTARLQMNLAELQLKEARSAAYPQIGVFAGYNYSLSHAAIGFATMSRNYGYTYGLTASIPIFDGFRKNTAIKNAKIEAQSGEASLAMTQLNLEQELYEWYIAYSSGLKLMRMEEGNLDVAKENTNFALEKLKQGMISDIDFRTIQQQQMDAESRWLQAQYQVKLAESELLRLSGSLYMMLIAN